MSPADSHRDSNETRADAVQELRDLDLFRLEKRRLKVGIPLLFVNYLMGRYNGDGVKLFSEVHSDKARGKRQAAKMGILT